MSLAGEGMWDPQQREWLQAMGHSLLVLAADEAVEAPTALGESGEASPPPRTRAIPRAPVAEEPAAPTAPVRPRTDAAAKLAALEAARRAGAARNASGPLGEALLRATAQPPAAAARMLRELAIDPAALRDDPAAKRTLWARLRKLRKVAK